MLIAQTPYAPALKNTFELDRPPSEDFARIYYGQVDHVRLFGRDIVALFNGAGLTGSLLPHAQLLGDFDARDFGCNRQEPFFAFSKPAQELAAA